MRGQRYIMVFEAIRTILKTSSIENLTIANIANVSGLHVNTVNYYFNGKTDMLMRFHTYMSEFERRNLPEAYKHIPDDQAKAVRAFLEIVDFELYTAAVRPISYQKIIIHLYGMMDSQPQVKYYLGEKQEERYVFLRSVLQRYCAAGVIRPDTLDEGIAAMVTIGTGYTLISEYYDTPAMIQHMANERRRIASLMIEPRYQSTLNRLMS